MTFSDILIRKAKTSDLDGLMAVEVKAFLPSDAYSSEKIASQLTDPSRRYFIAEENAGIVGYGAVAIQDPSFALMEDVSNVEKEIGVNLYGQRHVGVLTSMGVIPEFRGKGIGQKLLEERIKWLRENKVNYVFAHVWPNGGFPGLGIKNGFKKVSTWRGKRQYSDGSNALLYFKKID